MPKSGCKTLNNPLLVRGKCYAPVSVRITSVCTEKTLCCLSAICSLENNLRVYGENALAYISNILSTE